MTDEEIIESFRRAKFPAKQVGILSERFGPKRTLLKCLRERALIFRAEE